MSFQIVYGHPRIYLSPGRCVAKKCSTAKTHEWLLKLLKWLWVQTICKN
jgi:hypothetical protein